MIRVELIPLGQISADLDLHELVRVANKIQHYFYFALGDTVETLGRPGEHAEYPFDHLVGLLKAWNQRESKIVRVGVLDDQLDHDELFSGIDRELRYIIVSTNDVEEIPRRSSKTLTAYVLLEIAAQLLTIEYRRVTRLSCSPVECAAPWHEETRSCLFDWSEKRQHTAKKLLKAPHLCLQCQADLSQANVPGSVRQACLEMVRAAVRPRFKAIARDVATDPLVRFLFGGFVLSALTNLISLLRGSSIWGTVVLARIIHEGGRRSTLIGEQRVHDPVSASEEHFVV